MPKKIAAGKVILNSFSLYKWINERSTYMFKNISKIVSELKLENYEQNIIINDKYFDKCIIDNIQITKPIKPNQCVIM